jgi:hypothetical protein
MTYAELLIEILQMNQEQLQANVTVLSYGEFYEMTHLHFATIELNDELDHGHPYLTF